MSDTDPDPDPSTAELMLSLRHPSQVEVDEMRRIGAQPGACGLDAEGRYVVVQRDGSLRELKVNAL
jgi:hypothetical protein|tara:strand:- start:17422 stop:17619 length:198 start_codon:yes stop_codon:yes gene_type:complete